MPNRALIISASTRIPTLEFFIDGIPRATHSMELEKAEEPLEDGAVVTDHATALPEQLKLIGWVSEIENPGRPSAAWERLRQLNRTKEAITVHTELGTYEEMLPTKIETDHSKRGLEFRMDLKQIQRVGDTEGSLPAGSTSGPASGRSGSVDRGRVAFPQ